ncbi:MAG TPA: dienelactone hydrolase family protein [Acidobacteriota bacterium]|nr:dienelactone hydrolase family protein [Acidobacteriota bacterium]
MIDLRRKFIWIALTVIVAAAVILWQPWEQRLKVIQKGGKGPPTFVLLHGYGSTADHWIPFTQSIPFSPQGRYLLPEAPLATPRIDGGMDGRAWWEMDFGTHLRANNKGIDFVHEHPEGLDLAAAQVRALLSSKGNSRSQPFILGGFSQGAMVACDIAFASDEPLAALVILSGNPINEDIWRSGFDRRRGMPVFMSHGRNDDILPFDLAERLHTELQAAGLKVTFVPFNGGHEIPEEVVVALGQFLAQIKP